MSESRIGRIVEYAVDYFLLSIVLCGYLAFIGAGWVVDELYDLPPMCSSSYIDEYASPDGKKKLIVFERSCGATTWFTTQASLIDANETWNPHEFGNVFYGEVYAPVSRVPQGPCGGPELKVTWKRPDFLVLSYNGGSSVKQTDQTVDGIRIRYIAEQFDAAQEAELNKITYPHACEAEE